MKILLVNPNQVRNPPVPPLGLENVFGVLAEGGHHVEALDLCFSEDPSGDLGRMLDVFSPDFAGLSVRNVDSVLFPGNEFYLDTIRDLIMQVRSRCSAKILIGGAGVMTGPGEIMRYLGADGVAAGRADPSINGYLREMAGRGTFGRIWSAPHRTEFRCPRVSGIVNYRQYAAAGGIVGFETHRGCSGSCVYCIEANTKVSFRRTEDVIGEIRSFLDAGYEEYHLCDPEVNEDHDHAVAFCSALKQSGLPIRWAVYMKPAEYSQKLFRLLASTGVQLITLTVDSFRKCALYWSDVEKMVFLSRSVGIPLAIDFLAGFPGEDDDHLRWCLDFFRRIQPQRVNINTYIRLYRTLQISRLILGDASLRRFLVGAVHEQSLVQPVFYNQITNDRLKELIGGDPLFRIEESGQGVNYTRAGSGMNPGQFG